MDMSTHASMNVKKDSAIEDEEAEELINKKQPPNGRGAIPSRKSPINRTC